LPSVALYSLGMASVVRLETPQIWCAGGLTFAGGAALQVVFLRRRRLTRQLAVFAIGLASLALSIVGALADTQWLFIIGFLGFLATFAVRMMLLVDRETPGARRWSIYLKAFWFPLLAIGGFSRTEWLLWAGLVGVVASVLLSTGLDILMVIRRRRRVGQ
jgi:hypothetical protein